METGMSEDGRRSDLILLRCAGPTHDGNVNHRDAM